MNTTNTAYHFVNDTLRDGSPIPDNGEWLVHDGEIELCASGYHASKCPFDALQYAPGNTLCLVEFGGKVIEGDDKIVSEKRKIIDRFDAEELLFKFARDSALSVIHLWDAPEVVKEFLETGNPELRDAARAAARAAAWDAARDAARAAAWDAARAAAWDAARAAAWDAARDAARAAAWDAARDAARAAARDAARAAAWDAGREKQRLLFKAAVEDQFKRMGAL